MTYIVTIPEGYNGVCARCSKADGVHLILEAVDPPIPGNPKFDLPDITGVRSYVCDSCLKPEDEIVPDD